MAQKAHWVVVRACLNPSWPTAMDTARYAIMTLANLSSCGASFLTHVSILMFLLSSQDGL